MKKSLLPLLTLCICLPVFSASEKEAMNLPLDQWTYIHVDDNRGKWGDFDQPGWLKYFGLAMGDLTGDGYKDIVSGRYFYRNPGGDMTGKWERVDFGLNVDAILILDVDNDEFGDVIAQALPDIYWLEAEDREGSSWKATKLTSVPATDHVNSQGFIGLDNNVPEFCIASGEGVIYVAIQMQKGKPNTFQNPLATGTSSEGIASGDINGNGYADIVAGDGETTVYAYIQSAEHPTNYPRFTIGHTQHPPDRIEIADLNGDGHLDVIVTEERYPGPDPDANLFWFENPGENVQQEWKRHTVVTEYSLNNLDVADMDGDGDIDIITCEHKGPKEKLQIFQNDGKGNFTEVLIDEGKESHLGTQVADLDGDGDLDIVSIAWDDYKDLHLWRNDAIKK